MFLTELLNGCLDKGSGARLHVCFMYVMFRKW